MTIDDSNWSYNDFLAFLLIYGAEAKPDLSENEVNFIKARTGLNDIAHIKAKVDSVSDAEVLEIIEDYRKRYLTTPEAKQRVRQQLEDLLAAQHKNTQLEKVIVHFLERLI